MPWPPEDPDMWAVEALFGRGGKPVGIDYKEQHDKEWVNTPDREHPKPIGDPVETFNQGPVEKPKKEKRLPVMEIFGPTIQGEGLMIGVRTYFVRMGLCDYKCVMCDSMHAVDPMRVKANAHWMSQRQAADQIFDKLKNQDTYAHWVTLSGGNPAIHDLSEMIDILQVNGIQIAVETQGTLLPAWIERCEVITVSPKSPGMGEKFEEELFMEYIRKFKYHTGFNIKVVVFSAQDLEFARHINQIAVEHHCADKMYLSLGNPFPPGFEGQFDNSRPAKDLGKDRTTLLKLELMKSYDQLSEDLLKMHDMYNVRFLPQLHVLAWGNKQGV